MRQEKETLPIEVKQLGDPVTQKDVDSYLKIQDAEDKSYRLRAIVGAWDKQQTADRKMRRGYAWFFIGIIAFQIVAINVAFFLIGYDVIKLDPLVLKVFFIPILAEIVSMTLIILKYLFPEFGTELLELIRKL